MNKFKKIGLSALAGSLVAMSAQAYEITMSGGASVAATSADGEGKTGYYMNDSITFTVAGETDSGLAITTKLELDGGANASSSFDSRSLAIAHDDFGKFMHVMRGSNGAASYSEFLENLSAFGFPGAQASLDHLFTETVAKNNLQKGVYK